MEWQGREQLQLAGDMDELDGALGECVSHLYVDELSLHMGRGCGAGFKTCSQRASGMPKRQPHMCLAGASLRMRQRPRLYILAFARLLLAFCYWHIASERLSAFILAPAHALEK